MNRRHPLLASATLLSVGLAAAALSAAQDAAPSPADSQALPPASPAFYDARVRPVFSANCYRCHTDKMSGGLRLDTRESMLKGGDSGAAMVVGSPEKSLLVTAIHQTDPELKMPPQGAKLSDAQIADIESWIKAGAVWGAAGADSKTAPPANP